MYTLYSSPDRVLLLLYGTAKRAVYASDRAHPFQLDHLLDLLDRIDAAIKEHNKLQGTEPFQLWQLKQWVIDLVDKTTEKLSRQGFFDDDFPEGPRRA